AVYDDLVHYYKYSCTAHALILPGSALIPLFDLITDTHGYIARDDKRQEIVVAFRGRCPSYLLLVCSHHLTSHIEIGANSDCTFTAGTKVHMGFQAAWRSIAPTLIATITAMLVSFPSYTIVTTGHSLGGALASFAAVSLQMTFPTNKVRVYTYGAPRVGNKVFATWANTILPLERAFRVVHANDGVPTMAPEFEPFGYKHHGTEYWALSPHSPATTRICIAPGELEDPEGSKKIFPSLGINPPHLVVRYGSHCV
ncbi:alpha/beta-hydrolase, partial [Exidia glandulosa HHB12029]